MNTPHSARVLLCPECDLLVSSVQLRRDQLSRCPRCRRELERGGGLSREAALAIAASAAPLWLVMNVFPLVTLTLGGMRRETTLFGAGMALAAHGMPLLAALVVLTAVLAPGAQIVLALYVMRLEGAPRSGLPGRGVRWFLGLKRWSMADVFMLGCLVSIVKLSHLADLVVGPALWACAALVCALAFLSIHVRPHSLFARGDDAGAG